MTQDNRPAALPTGWPTDGRSRMVSSVGIGWVLTHPDRDTLAFKSGRWEPAQQRGVA